MVKLKGRLLWVQQVYREVKSTSRNEDEYKEKGPEKMGFELKTKGSNLFEEEEPSESDDEVEPQTSTLRRFDQVRRPTERYSPLDFRSSFVLFAITNEPRSINEEVNFEEGKLW